METIVAPVDLFIYYKVLRYEDKWSYQVKMDFCFTNYEENIKGFLLVENGVYTFDSENHATIECKRIGKQFKEYFQEKLGPIITEVYNKEKE